MQGDDFLYFLRSEGFYLSIGADGALISTVNPVPLVFSPDGWQEISIFTERNKKYFGLDRTFTIPLNFVEDGARILKYLFYTKGIEAEAELIIQEQRIDVDSTSFEFTYEDLYVGDVDFSTFSDTGVKVSCNIIEGGLPKLIKANENTTYEIDLDVDEAVRVKMDGLNIKSASNYVTIPENTVAFLPAFHYNTTWIQVQHVGNEGTLFNTEQQSTNPLVNQFSNTAFNDNSHLDNYFFKANEAVTATFKGTFTVRLYNGSHVKLYLKNSNGTRTILLTMTGNNSPFGEDISQTFIVSASLPMAANEKLYLICEFFDAADPSGFTRIDSAEFSVSYASRYKTTYIKGLRAIDLFKAILFKITDGAYTADSALLTSRVDLVCTSGDALRGIAGAKIKTSLSQFFQSFNSILNIAMGKLNDKVILEEKDFWFDSASVIDLGEINDLEISPAMDFIYNTIKIGYPDQDYDSTNGKDEPNTTQLYTTPIKRVAKEMNLVSEYRADMYGIEFTRINLEGKRTTDSSSDNDTFIIQVNKAPVQEFEWVPGPIPIPIPLPLHYTLDRSLNAGATGLIDPPSAFNLGLSPKHNFYKHDWFFRSFLYPLDTEYIKFQTTDKNAELVTDIIEKADVLISDLRDSKFLPFFFRLETIVPDNLQQLLNLNPVRMYQFSYGGMILKGMAMKVGIEPSSRKSQVYQLLATADRDISQIVNYNG